MNGDSTGAGTDNPKRLPRGLVPSRRSLLAGTVAGALAGAGGLTALAGAPPASAASSYVPGSGWINVVTQYQADPTGTSDSTAAIQAALDDVPATGALVYLPAGTYLISAALTVKANTTIQGDGDGATIITQSSTTANGLQGTDGQYLTVSDLWLQGPSSGSGVGILFDISANTSVPYTRVSRVTISRWGSHGLYLDTPIVSQFDSVVSMLNGGDGFHPTAAVSCTSCGFSSCYANANQGTGYFLVNLQYSVLDSCAADNNGNGYDLSGCHAVTLTGCGAEATTTDNFVFQSGSGNSVVGCWVYHNNATGILAENGESKLTLIGCTENSPLGGASSFVNAASGTSGALLNVTDVSGNVLPGSGWTVLA